MNLAPLRNQAAKTYGDLSEVTNTGRSLLETKTRRMFVKKDDEALSTQLSKHIAALIRGIVILKTGKELRWGTYDTRVKPWFRRLHIVILPLNITYSVLIIIELQRRRRHESRLGESLLAILREAAERREQSRTTLS